MNRLLLVSIFFCLASFLSYSQGYKIKVKIKNYPEKAIQLGYYFADKQFIEKESKTDKTGMVIFEGKEALPGGMYLIILPGQKYFDILISDDQEFTLETDTGETVKSMKVIGDKENEVFYKYMNQLANFYQIHQNLENKKKEVGMDTVKIQKEMDELNNTAMNLWKSYTETNKSSFFATLLTAMNGQPMDGYSDENFFKHIQFSDSRLLRTPVIHKSYMMILARNLNNNKPLDVLLKESDRLIALSKANDKVYQYVSTQFLDFFATYSKVGMNEAFVYVADKYFRNGKASWLDTVGIKFIEERYAMFKQSFVGQKAPEFEVESLEGKLVALKDVQAKHLLILFWSTGCGHCEKATEKTIEFYNKYKSKDVIVISIYTKNDKKAWQEFVEKYKTQDWINVWDPNGEAKFGEKYYAISTPFMLLLDENKTIIARRFGDEPIRELIDLMAKEFEKK